MSADGDWAITMNTPMGAQKATLTLKTSGTDLEGKMAGAQGTQEFKGGSVDGDKLSWSIDMTQPMPMKLKFTASVAGDNISGEVELGSFGKATFAGPRA
jgi:hypothetical protein